MSIYTEIVQNKRRTWLLMAIFIAVVTVIGWFWGQQSGSGYFGLFGALGFSIASAAFSYFASDKIALATSGAKKIEKNQAPRYFRITENLCIGAGLPMPDLYVINSPALNAFATGRDPKHAAVAVTSGLLRRLSDQELEGVIAHELSHIKNYDIRLMTIVVVLVGAVSILSSWFRRTLFWGSKRRRDKQGSHSLLTLIGLILLVVAPIVGTLIKLAISRRREFLADASSAYLTRYPEGLASALEEISKDSNRLGTASEATAHLFIANPFRGTSLAKLFSTHPPVEERIKKLRNL
ncbi:MAG: M48 family metalloprotease [Patescibacteria group bacterium]|nr:M48 family metalloprotease [Patescibacteria group bacterium]